MIFCDWCKEGYTEKDLKEDKIRFYKTNAGLLCELCYEDYLEGRTY